MKPLFHAFEEFDALGIFSQLNYCFFPTRSSPTSRASSFHFAEHIHSVYFFHFHIKYTLHCFLHFSLICSLIYFKGILTFRHIFHTFLCYYRSNNNIVWNTHYAYTSSTFLTASFVIIKEL